MTFQPAATNVHAQVRAMQAQSSAQAADRAREAVMQRAMAFGAAHADVVEWLMDNESNDFAQSLSQYLNDHGFLTEGQINAVRKKLAPAAAGTAIDVGRIEQAFDNARESGLKRLRMHLDTFKFTPAGESSRNKGGIYVKRSGGDGAYLGKVLGGKFFPSRECTSDEEQRVVAAASDPAAAAKAYGQRTGQCCMCGLELTAEDSIERSMGAICAGRYKL